MLALATANPAAAASATVSGAFNFTHSGSVSTGLLSIGGLFSNTTITSAPSLALAQFDPALGRLTGVTVSVTTTTSSFVVAPTGLLSLATSGSATRRLAYAVTAGSLNGGDYNEVTTSAGTLLTLLSIGGGDIGGAPLAKSSSYGSAADLARFTGSGTIQVVLTATNTLSVVTLVSLLDGAGLAGTGTYAGTVRVTYQYTPWSVGGYVYKDVDHDGFKGPAEAGTGLVLYAKLLSSSGSALQATAVDPVSGAYGFAAANGSYRIIVDDNASLADTTPLQLPAGWSATQAAGLSRDLTLAGDLAAQDFGLVQAMPLSGRVFIDDGRGGGVANDGRPNGSEVPATGRAVELVDAGGSVLDRSAVAGDGTYRLYIPPSVAAGSTLRVRQAADAATLTTGVGLGNTAGSFDRATRAVSFVVAGNVAYTNLDFGCVPVPSLTGGGTLAALPGASVVRAHRFTATSSGRVSFSVTTTATAGSDVGSAILYLDANGNGLADPGEAVIAGPVDVIAGQSVALVLKLTIPSGVDAGSRIETALRATMAFTNAVPAMTTSYSLVDDTVVEVDGGLVRLVKSVDKSSAAPGTNLTYTVSFTNPGTASVTSFSIADTTPNFTTFGSVGPVVVPAGLLQPAVTTPAVGSSGPLRWVFGGQLMPGASGSVEFTVQIAPP